MYVGERNLSKFIYFNNRVFYVVALSNIVQFYSIGIVAVCQRRKLKSIVLVNVCF